MAKFGGMPKRDVLWAKSKRGIATPKPILDRIKSRLKRIKAIENE